MPQNTSPFIKFRNSLLYQFMDRTARHRALLFKRPQNIFPSNENHKKYLEDIIKGHSDKYPQEEILSIQAFACHGLIYENQQVAAANIFNATEKYYKFINVESNIRYYARSLRNVYFIVLFACCRQKYKPTDTGVLAIQPT